MQHQPLATRAHRALQQGLQGGIGGHTLLWHGLHPVVLDGRDQRFQGSQAFVKHTAVGGQVKHHEAHLSPRGIVRLLLPGGGLGMGKAATAGPQLAVHGRGGPACGKPRGGHHGFAAARAQGVAVPIAAHAVVFFAHPVVGQRHSGAVHVGQQQGGCIGCPSCRGSQREQGGERAQGHQAQPGQAASAVHRGSVLLSKK